VLRNLGVGCRVSDFDGSMIDGFKERILILCPDSRADKRRMTHTHKRTQAKERERIVKAGGFVQDNRVNGIMEVIPLI
jgi:hypothetical protein